MGLISYCLFFNASKYGVVRIKDWIGIKNQVEMRMGQQGLRRQLKPRDVVALV
jgi:hypothetical protein